MLLFPQQPVKQRPNVKANGKLKHIPNINHQNNDPEA